MNRHEARHDHLKHELIWATGACALLLLILEVVLAFDFGGPAGFIRLGDLTIAYLYLRAIKQAKLQVREHELDPLPVSMDLWVVWIFGAFTVASILTVATTGGSLPGAAAVSALGKACIIVLALRLRARLLAREYSPTMRAVVLSPPATIAMSFLLAITAGWLLLCLPEASASHAPLSPLDALFTSTSATCVTGLIVKDTPNDFSPFGLIVILVLIQVGGLGIMTLGGLFGIARGQRVSMHQRMIVRDTLIAEDPHTIGRTLGLIALYAFSVEAAGAALLYLRWLLGGQAPLRAAWLATFHAISAFCNAGFTLFSNSLEDYSGDLAVNVIVGALIIVGGIGFPVVLDLYRYCHGKSVGRRPRLSLHTKLVLSTTAYLLLLGFLGFWLLEWTNTLLSRDVAESFYAAGFQSLTPRTAGFNTVPISALTEAMKFLLIMLMFVGASPGSTGGGIKTCTLAVVVALGRTMIQGGSHVHVFGRGISEGVRHRAVAIVILFGLSVLLWTFALCVSEGGSFINVLFETVSAFATVGLSAGLTPTLTKFGRIAIIVAMYTGRVGPLTVALAMARRRTTAADIVYPEEPVMVG